MRREYRAGPHIRRGEIRPSARLLAYARQLGFDTPDAEDLVQEVYLLLLDPTAASVEPVRDLFGYLFGYLRRLAANARRRERRRVRLIGRQRFATEVGPDPEAQLLASMAIDWTLNRIPPADAELLRWRFLGDEPLQTIAERLEITEKAAWLRICRALIKARRRFGRPPEPSL